ncbi:cytochrome P450 94A1-like [Prosopis cineraria]|uniref:cytochrome P450 94A1-like n=1 Tax=Prosopis cineraria TaxID=364024 RepID=UPI002410ACDC|nr:cytochrome P450 94A1-like [Prosopis cineraria]
MPIQLLAFVFLFCLPWIFFLLFKTSSPAATIKKKNKLVSPPTTVLPKTYPVIGSYLDLLANFDRRVLWFSDIVLISPANTYVLHRFLGQRAVITGNPAVVQHILKTHFPIYQKGQAFRETLTDFLGNGIFNTDGDTWKFQRQVASHEFNTRSLRKFVEHVVDTELNQRLIPILATAAAQDQILDFQDILQRFAFDNICKIAFGFDPEYLSQSLGPSKFAQAFDAATEISSRRAGHAHPITWQIQKLLDIGSERRLRLAISEVREFAKNIVRDKKRQLTEGASLESADMLSRFLSSGHSDEDFVTDIVISFILAGKDTTSAALTWFFWLLSKNPEVEKKIVKEVGEISESPVYDEVKDMVFTHAALSESMRLYPPVPMDTKEVMADDVLPDGTSVKKGMRVTYHVYAMGRMEKLWGSDWAEYKPERWLERDGNGEDSEKWRYVGRDAYSYPVFQAGPRICLGKDMAYLQMKRVVGAILTRFRVVPATAEGEEPQFVSFLTSKMKGGFPVKIHSLV